MSMVIENTSYRLRVRSKQQLLSAIIQHPQFTQASKELS